MIVRALVMGRSGSSAKTQPNKWKSVLIIPMEFQFKEKVWCGLAKELQRGTVGLLSWVKS